MSEKGRCKSCVESVIVSEEVIQELIKEAEQAGSEMVSEQLYKERLSICEKNCSFLQYGTTCMYSGSLVSYRAKFTKNGCPNPTVPKW